MKRIMLLKIFGFIALAGFSQKNMIIIKPSFATSYFQRFSPLIIAQKIDTELVKSILVGRNTNSTFNKRFKAILSGAIILDSVEYTYISECFINNLTVYQKEVDTVQHEPELSFFAISNDSLRSVYLYDDDKWIIEMTDAIIVKIIQKENHNQEVITKLRYLKKQLEKRLNSKALSEEK